MAHEPIPNIPVVVGGEGDWEKYQLVIIQKLNEHSQAISKVDSKVDAVQTDVALLRSDVGKLEVKAGFWGSLGGAVVAVVAMLKIRLVGG